MRTAFSSVSKQENGTYSIKIFDDIDQSLVYEKCNLLTFEGARNEIYLWTIGKAGGPARPDARGKKLALMQLTKGYRHNA